MVHMKYILIAVVLCLSLLCGSSIAASWSQRGFVMSPDYDGPVTVIQAGNPTPDGGMNYTVQVPWFDNAGKPKVSKYWFWSMQSFKVGQTAFVRNGELTTMPPM